MLKQDIFNLLYDKWKASNYHIDLKPSVDRKDDYLPYIFDNIQIMTWKENRLKGNLFRKSGLNNKNNKAVLQFTKDNKFIKEYYSAAQAFRETGIDRSQIGAACKGCKGDEIVLSAGGFIWKYK